jgi:hypothetical protein
MIILASTSSKIQVITGSAVSTQQVHASWVDNAAGTITPGATNTLITSAATTDIVAAPASSTYRNVKFISVRNSHATSQNAITIQHTDGTNVVVLWYGILLGGMMVQIDENAKVTVFTAGGIAYADPGMSGRYYNNSTANQGAGFNADTYVAGSNILIPAQRPRAGTIFTCEISGSKTAAGTATPIVYLRYGTGAATTDTALATHTFSAGTAATDQFRLRIRALYRTAGSGTSAVVQSHCEAISQPTSGFSSLLKGIWVTSAGHDSTTANTYLGVSINGGASAAWTIYQVIAKLENI